jgi:hypothetical protein
MNKNSICFQIIRDYAIHGKSRRNLLDYIK